MQNKHPSQLDCPNKHMCLKTRVYGALLYILLLIIKNILLANYLIPLSHTHTCTDALLKPAFLVDILLMFEVFQDPVIYDVFAISAIHLKNLPIVSAPLMLHIMERVCTDQDMPQLNDDSKLTILDWAESLGLMFRIGEGTKREVYYFVPLLATSLLGDKAKFSWDPKTEKAYKSETIVLYAYLRFPATYQFFYRLLAVLLKDGFHESKNTHNFRINYGCNEAILPVCCADPPRVLGVMAIYHPLQNVIEFRTRYVTDVIVTFACIFM